MDHQEATKRLLADAESRRKGDEARSAKHSEYHSELEQLLERSLRLIEQLTTRFHTLEMRIKRLEERAAPVKVSQPIEIELEPDIELDLSHG